MHLKPWILSLLLLSLLANKVSAQGQYAFRITLTDKSGAPSVANPSVFLSQRAIDRRSQQGIAVDSTDRPISPVYTDSILRLTQGKFHVKSNWLNTLVILLEDSGKILQLQGLSFIQDIKLVGFYVNGLHIVSPSGDSSAKPDDPVSETAFKTSADPAWYGSTWGQTNFSGGQCLHDQGWLGQGKLIAVIDDGFHGVNTAAPFDSLFSSGRIKDHYNFVKADPDVFGFSAHGTQVLSTIAAYEPNSYVGAAPLADFALYISEEITGEQQVELDNLIAAFERADSVGADIVSTSLGYNIFYGISAYQFSNAELNGKSTPASRAANLASQKGMLMVITMGNEGTGGLLSPGDADSALTVGNMNASKIPASNSGYGPNGDGVIKPEVTGLGSPAQVVSSNGNIFGVNGTSVATPQIAGYAACLWQGFPALTSWELKRVIVAGSNLWPNAQMPQHGYGAADFCKSLTILDLEEVPSREAPELSISPNPFERSIKLKVTAKKQGPLQLIVSDLTGTIVLQTEVFLKQGQNDIPLMIQEQLSTGVYLGCFKWDNQEKTIKLMKY